jgi:membrane protein involved in colicin uptake
VDSQKVYSSETFVCTKNDEGKFVWLEATDSKAITDKRAADAAAKAAADKLVAEKAAAAQAAAQGPVTVVGTDIYRLDGSDNDGIGCEG